MKKQLDKDVKLLHEVADGIATYRKRGEEENERVLWVKLADWAASHSTILANKQNFKAWLDGLQNPL